MKKIFLFLSLAAITSLQGMAQDRYFTKNAAIGFFSATPIEKIEAHNNQSVSVLDTKSGKVEFSALMKGFEFEKALMQEHFNENYVESGKYPKAAFSGVITNPETINFKKDGSYKVNIKGNFTLHGVTREIEVPALINVKGKNITATSEFSLSPQDYKIEIPKLVQEKIAKEIKVSVNAAYQEFKS